MDWGVLDSTQTFQALKIGRPKPVNCWSLLETQLTSCLCETWLLLWFGNHNIETPENVFTQNLSHNGSEPLSLKCLIWKLSYGPFWVISETPEGSSGFPRPKSVSALCLSTSCRRIPISIIKFYQICHIF